MQDLEEYPEPPQWPKKVIAVFLIILFIGLGSIGGYAGFVYISYLYGTDVIDGVAQKDGVNYVFANSAWDRIEQIYLQEQREEFVLCLTGSYSDTEVVIQDFSIPQTFSRGFAHVQYEGCPEQSIGTLHSHPYRRCTPSSQDRSTLAAMGTDVVGFVMCDRDRVGIY